MLTIPDYTLGCVVQVLGAALGGGAGVLPATELPHLEGTGEAGLQDLALQAPGEMRAMIMNLH